MKKTLIWMMVCMLALGMAGGALADTVAREALEATTPYLAMVWWGDFPTDPAEIEMMGGYDGTLPTDPERLIQVSAIQSDGTSATLFLRLPENAGDRTSYQGKTIRFTLADAIPAAESYDDIDMLAVYNAASVDIIGDLPEGEVAEITETEIVLIPYSEDGSAEQIRLGVNADTVMDEAIEKGAAVTILYDEANNVALYVFHSNG